MQKQGVTLGDLPITLSNQEIPESFIQKEMLPEPCGKRNALMNLFDEQGVLYNIFFFAIIFLCVDHLRLFLMHALYTCGR